MNSAATVNGNFYDRGVGTQVRIEWGIQAKRSLDISINLLSLTIKLQFLLLCSHTFLTEVVERSCKNINRIELE